jgi:hypothetical protein
MFNDAEIATSFRELTGTPFGCYPLASKLTEARESRPTWAINIDLLTRHIVGDLKYRKLCIAHRYWLLNQTAREIANDIGISLEAVQNIIYRLQKT